MSTSKAWSWVIAVVGALVIATPIAFGDQGHTVFFWSDIITGLILIILGAWAGISADPGVVRTLNWINAGLGVWVIVLPFIFGYPAINWANSILGSVVIIAGLWAALAVPSDEISVAS